MTIAAAIFAARAPRRRSCFP